MRGSMLYKKSHEHLVRWGDDTVQSQFGHCSPCDQVRKRIRLLPVPIRNVLFLFFFSISLLHRIHEKSVTSATTKVRTEYNMHRNSASTSPDKATNIVRFDLFKRCISETGTTGLAAFW